MGYFSGDEELSLKKFVFIFLSFLGTGLIVNSSFFKHILNLLFGTQFDDSDNKESVKHGNFILIISIESNLLRSYIFCRNSFDAFLCHGKCFYQRFHQEI